MRHAINMSGVNEWQVEMRVRASPLQQWRFTGGGAESRQIDAPSENASPVSERSHELQASQLTGQTSLM